MKKQRIKTCLTAITILILNFSITNADVYYDDGLVHNIDYSVSHLYAEIRDGGSPVGPTTVNLLTDGFLNYVQCFNYSQLNVSGGTNNMLAASENAQVNISSGSLRNAMTFGQSQINISGGNLETVQIENLYLNSPQRANISGGTINKLIPCITLEQNQHLNHSADFPLSSLSSYGVQIAPAIANLIATSFTTPGTSSLTVSSGNIDSISTSGTSTVNIFGGNIEEITTHENSVINFFGGTLIDEFSIWGNATVNISGGDIDYLETSQTPTIYISGGSLDSLRAEDESAFYIKGYDFTLSQGLSWDTDGKTILGTGILTGKWFDNTTFEIPIDRHDITATITAIPEPATLVLLSLAIPFLRRKNQN